MQNNNELVLVAPKEDLPLSQFKDGWLDEYYDDAEMDSYPIRENYTTILHKWLENAFFMDRPKAEKDPNFKQFIPYCVLKQNGKYFVYKRTKKGGENRLHDLYSLGVGGHICSLDNTQTTLSDTYWSGLYRELQEEVGLSLDSYSHQIIGAIYDDSNEVGQVHLGIVHIINVKEGIQLSCTDLALTNGEFDTLENIKKHIGYFENWSQIVIKHLEE